MARNAVLKTAKIEPVAGKPFIQEVPLHCVPRPAFRQAGSGDDFFQNGQAIPFPTLYQAFKGTRKTAATFLKMAGFTHQDSVHPATRSQGVPNLNQTTLVLDVAPPLQLIPSCPQRAFNRWLFRSEHNVNDRAVANRCDHRLQRVQEVLPSTHG